LPNLPYGPVRTPLSFATYENLNLLLQNDQKMTEKFAQTKKKVWHDWLQVWAKSSPRAICGPASTIKWPANFFWISIQLNKALRIKLKMFLNVAKIPFFFMK